MNNLMKFSTPIDVEFDWHITNLCNFNCDYCYPQIRATKNIAINGSPSVERIVKSFDETGLVANISMTGGEPFLFPSFLDLCEKLTKKHHIGINTNLSTGNVLDFASRINPQRVSYIWASTHLKQREKLKNGLKKYASNFKALSSKGFNVVAMYVAHPENIPHLERDIKKLREMGVNHIQIKVFKGVFHGKSYPMSFKRDEVALIDSLNGGYPNNIQYAEGSRNFKGKLCTAGVTFFKIDVAGNVQRCASDPQSFGNIYKGTFKPGKVLELCRITNVLALSQCNKYANEK